MTGTYNLLLYFYIIVYIYFILVLNLKNTTKVNYSIMDKTKNQMHHCISLHSDCICCIHITSISLSHCDAPIFIKNAIFHNIFIVQA